jgi:hypothetical protein
VTPINTKSITDLLFYFCPKLSCLKEGIWVYPEYILKRNRKRNKNLTCSGRGIVLVGEKEERIDVSVVGITRTNQVPKNKMKCLSACRVCPFFLYVCMIVLSFFLSVCFVFIQSACLSAYLPVCPPVCLSVCLSVRLSACLSACLPACPNVQGLQVY